MKLSTWDPFKEMEDLLEKYSRSDRRALTGHKEYGLTYSDWRPTVDIAEEKDHYSIKAELPGVKKEDVSVSFEDGILTLKGKKEHKTEEKDKKHHLIECSYGSFTRSFSLPKNIEADKIEASFTDGILSLRIPKSEESQPKQIDVKIK